MVVLRGVNNNCNTRILGKKNVYYLHTVRYNHYTKALDLTRNRVVSNKSTRLRMCQMYRKTGAFILVLKEVTNLLESCEIC